MDQTFMTIHDLNPDASILFASDSIADILGYDPEEVRGTSSFEYFHPDEIPFARHIHSRGILLDKAAVLHYARIRSRDGSWVSCECCFTVVHDVLVASISRYQQGVRSERRAIEAPQIRRIFSCSPRDPRYHMLEHLSPKFRLPAMEREPRAALILNRFTRSLGIMFATDAVAAILGLLPEHIDNKSFYECIQESCLEDAVRCMESAKANDSIAYLRYWSRDPRRPEELEEEWETEEEDEGQDEDEDVLMGSDAEIKQEDYETLPSSNPMDTGDEGMPKIKSEAQSSPNHLEHLPSPSQPGDMYQGIPYPIPSVELEAVVSCTSDGLVVVLRRARPEMPMLRPPKAYHGQGLGLFAAPWGHSLLGSRTSSSPRPPFHQQSPLAHSSLAEKATNDDLMQSIRDVGVFAWALTGINGNIADHSRGTPMEGAQPRDGLPVWDPNAGDTEYQGPTNQALDRISKGKSSMFPNWSSQGAVNGRGALGGDGRHYSYEAQGTPTSAFGHCPSPQAAFHAPRSSVSNGRDDYFGHLFNGRPHDAAGPASPYISQGASQNGHDGKVSPASMTRAPEHGSEGRNGHTRE